MSSQRCRWARPDNRFPNWNRTFGAKTDKRQKPGVAAPGSGVCTNRRWIAYLQHPPPKQPPKQPLNLLPKSHFRQSRPLQKLPHLLPISHFRQSRPLQKLPHLLPRSHLKQFSLSNRQHPPPPPPWPLSHGLPHGAAACGQAGGHGAGAGHGTSTHVGTILHTVTHSCVGTHSVTQRVAWYGTQTFLHTVTSLFSVTGMQRVLQTGTHSVLYSVL